jgi:hypothetical protein
MEAVLNPLGPASRTDFTVVDPAAVVRGVDGLSAEGTDGPGIESGDNLAELVHG